MGKITDSSYETILIICTDGYYKYKLNSPHDPCDMTNYTNKHYTMT